MFLGIVGNAYSQAITVGITIRTIHRAKAPSMKAQKKCKCTKYNNWNPGITVGYQTRDNITFETGFILNSYKKLTWVTAAGYRYGDWEFQLGGATGYKSVGQPWIRPGYFINYFGEDVKIKLNHEIINVGTYKQINLKQ